MPPEGTVLPPLGLSAAAIGANVLPGGYETDEAPRFACLGWAKPPPDPTFLLWLDDIGSGRPPKLSTGLGAGAPWCPAAVSGATGCVRDIDCALGGICGIAAPAPAPPKSDTPSSVLGRLLAWLS